MSFSKLFDFAKGLTPPADGEDCRPWRVNVFWTLMILLVLVTGHIMSVHGYLSPIGISGHAQASELAVIADRGKSILYAIYSPQIRAKVRERCDASTPAEREEVNVELDRLMKEFKQAAREEFRPMPSCGEV